MSQSRYLAWLCLKSAPDLGLSATLELLKLYPQPEDFVGKPSHPLYSQGILKAAAKEHLKSLQLPQDAQRILKLMEQHEIQFLPYTDADYPVQLREIFAPPLILYLRGNLANTMEHRRLAVVGTRKASAYGREMCRKLLAPLCKEGLCIISGLAYGIDTMAHNTALQNNAPTIAVLAGGLDKIYPSQNQQVAEKIMQNGALVCEYEPGNEPERWNFPARNRIISALSEAVFIVEGPMNSGAMLTAKNALEQNRDVFALPGNINNANAAGPNHLIKHGAALISTSEDLFNLLEIKQTQSEQLELFPQLSPDEQKLFEIIKANEAAISFDEILIKSSFPIGRLSTQLTNLELKGLIAKESGNSFFLL